MTPLDHLVAALVQLEEQAQEIEHKQSFIRSAIEAFGVDADDALLVAVNADDGLPSFEPDSDVVDQLARLRGKDVVPHASATAEWMGRDVGFDLSPAATVAPIKQDRSFDYKLENSKQWNWELIAEEIEIGDIIGTRRTKHLQTVLGVSAATAQWMVKRCRELSLIDVERPKFDQQKARDAAAAAI